MQKKLRTGPHRLRLLRNLFFCIPFKHSLPRSKEKVEVTAPSKKGPGAFFGGHCDTEKGTGPFFGVGFAGSLCLSLWCYLRHPERSEGPIASILVCGKFFWVFLGGALDRVLVGICFFYFLYVIFLSYLMFRRRVAAVRRKDVEGRFFKSYMGETTEELQVWQNHYANQYQVPMVFYVACLFCLQQNVVNGFTIVLALTFVFTRMLHSYIHLGQNHVLKRARVFFMGVFVVAVLFSQALIGF